MNSCIIKYLLPPPPGGGLHRIEEYEYTSKRIYHQTFEELEQRVKGGCPLGYRCKIPLAMHHELIWRERGTKETDELSQPIFQVVVPSPSRPRCVG